MTSLLVGWLLAGRALRPVQRMTQDATRVDAGDLTRRMSVRGDDEIGSLGRSIDEMLGRLDRPSRGSASSSTTPPTSCGRRWR